MQMEEKKNLIILVIISIACVLFAFFSNVLANKCFCFSLVLIFLLFRRCLRNVVRNAFDNKPHKANRIIVFRSDCFRFGKLCHLMTIRNVEKTFMYDFVLCNQFVHICLNVVEIVFDTHQFVVVV
jgi:hypothetical protein